MEDWLKNEQAILVLRLLSAGWMAVLFLQSGLDKVFDRRGNLQWLTAHFAKSPLAAHVPTLLFLVTLMEVTAGTLCTIGMACGFSAMFERSP